MGVFVILATFAVIFEIIVVKILTVNSAFHWGGCTFWRDGSRREETVSSISPWKKAIRDRDSHKLHHPTPESGKATRMLLRAYEGKGRLLVYVYMAHRSLDKALFENSNVGIHLYWAVRFKILLGTARGLAYLHEESSARVIHRCEG